MAHVLHTRTLIYIVSGEFIRAQENRYTVQILVAYSQSLKAMYYSLY